MILDPTHSLVDEPEDLESHRTEGLSTDATRPRFRARPVEDHEQR
jgi:hypothetical protein